eukprot:COSAG01_NODE_18433_length_1076_cov_3.280450_1_plen_56_part_10
MLTGNPHVPCDRQTAGLHAAVRASSGESKRRRPRPGHRQGAAAPAAAAACLSRFVF